MGRSACSSVPADTWCSPLLQGGSLRVAASQVLAFVDLDEPAFGPFAEECLTEVENFAQISF